MVDSITRKVPGSWCCKTSPNPHSSTTVLDRWYEVFVLIGFHQMWLLHLSVVPFRGPLSHQSSARPPSLHPSWFLNIHIKHSLYTTSTIPPLHRSNLPSLTLSPKSSTWTSLLLFILLSEYSPDTPLHSACTFRYPTFILLYLLLYSWNPQRTPSTFSTHSLHFLVHFHLYHILSLPLPSLVSSLTTHYKPFPLPLSPLSSQNSCVLSSSPWLSNFFFANLFLMTLPRLIDSHRCLSNIIADVFLPL